MKRRYAEAICIFALSALATLVFAVLWHIGRVLALGTLVAVLLIVRAAVR